MSSGSLATRQQQAYPAADATELKSPQALQLAFQAFSELSTELTTAYQNLERRVSHLNQEVEQANQQRLRELSEKERLASRLENLLQLLPGGVIVLNSQGRITDCNAAAVELLGEALAGQFWRDVIRRQFAPRQDDGHEISLRNGRRVSLATRSLDDEPGQIILLTDQTETRKLQQHLARHQRLSAMGKMVSSLAHQIRTPLSAAMLYAGQLESAALPAAQTARVSSRLMSRLHNMERQVRDMLIFARGDTVLDTTLPVAALLGELETAAEVLLRTGKCDWRIECGAALLNCNKEALIGAFLNLIENALQAAGRNARLRISAAPDGERHERVRIAVCDNGPGIAPELQQQITEAFFTTKAQGTGLGLSVARIVAKAHGGQFFIETRTDGISGTEAGFVLPCRTAPSDKNREPE